MSKRKQSLLKSEYFLPYNTNLKEISRMLRKEMTESEKIIWQEYLRHLKYMVARQKIIDHFIVDFYIAKLKLVLEIDGKIHIKLKQRDTERENILKNYNLKIIRITNESIINNREKTFKKLDELIKKREVEIETTQSKIF